MADSKEKITDKEDNVEKKHNNSLTFDDKVIKKIVGFATSEVPGILAISGNIFTDILRSSDDPTKGITVEVGQKEVTIELKAVCEYGLNIPKIFQGVVDRVSDVIKEMTGLDVVEVKIHIYDVLNKEDFERQRKKRVEEKNAIRAEAVYVEAEMPEIKAVEPENFEETTEDIFEDTFDEAIDETTDETTDETIDEIADEFVEEMLEDYFEETAEEESAVIS